MSAYELAHGFTKLLNDYPTLLPDDLHQAHEMLAAKRKLAHIPLSKAPKHLGIAPGGTVEVFVKHANHKRGSGSSPRTVLDINYNNGSVTVPGSYGHHIQAAFKDVCPAITDDCIAQIVLEANDFLDRHIDYEINDVIANSEHDAEINTDASKYHIPDDDIPTADWFDPLFCFDDLRDAAVSYDQSQTAAFKTMLKPSPGDKIKVYWPLYDEHYHGIIAVEQNDSQMIVCDYAGIETLEFDNETWHYASSATLLSISA